MKVQINDYQESLHTKKAQINISHNTSYIMSKSSEIMPIEKYLDEQHSISLPVKANVNEHQPNALHQHVSNAFQQKHAFNYFQ